MLPRIAALHPANYMDLTGKVFGRLTIVGRNARRNSNHQAYWDCRCSCGGRTVTTGTRLKSGHTKSCGCLVVELAAIMGSRHTHGMTGTPEYKIWDGFRRRCGNPKDPQYRNYGGRGITVCDRWKSSFEAFFADMGLRPGPGYSIDRFPDNDGNYAPGNCRWATRIEQARNRRTNYLLTSQGKTLCIQEWASIIGIDYRTLYARLRLGWSIEKTLLTRPILDHNRSKSRKPIAGRTAMT
jgi:hypothetical protein